MSIAMEHPLFLAAALPVAVILFLLIRRNFVIFPDAEQQREYQRKRHFLRFFVLVTRIILFTLVLAALANPHTVETRIVQGNPSLKILVDSSRSFELFDQSVAERLKSLIEREIPVTMEYIGDRNSSALGTSLLNTMQGDDNILLISDGQNNAGSSLGDMMLFASMINTTISTLVLEPVKSDASVVVSGPAEATAGVETVFSAGVSVIGTLAPFELVVIVDGDEVLRRQVTGSGDYSFGKVLTVGYHTISAAIGTRDYFQENNAYYKVVKVEPKPKLLFVSGPGPMQQILTQLYNVDIRTELPEDLSPYMAVVLNNQRSAGLGTDRLSQYLIDGNGLAVLGGASAYDQGDYRDSLFETLLPVKMGTKQEKRSDVNVALVIDISQSTATAFKEGSQYSTEDVEKGLALGVLSDLKLTDKLSVIAFNQVPHLISPLSPLGPKLEDVGTSIARLTFVGSTFIPEALNAAYDSLAGANGSMYIILISDGGSPANHREAIATANRARSRGMKIYTIGVGVDLQTDEAFMQELASAGDGVYFAPTEAQRLKIIFETFEAGEETDKGPFPLEIINSHHFITEGMKLGAAVTGFNYVLPKSTATTLISTYNNKPIVTVWRFGLGRVVAYSTDDGSRWAPQLLRKGDSLVITRMLNWAIGDLGRTKEYDIDIPDTFQGEDIVVTVKSSRIPEASGLVFTKVGDNLYSSHTPSQGPGFSHILDVPVAVNSRREFYGLGLNPELASLVKSSRGSAFGPDEYKNIISKVKADSRRVKLEKVSYSWMLIIAALIVLIVEIAVRRAAENARVK